MVEGRLIAQESGGADFHVLKKVSQVGLSELVLTAKVPFKLSQ